MINKIIDLLKESKFIIKIQEDDNKNALIYINKNISKKIQKLPYINYYLKLIAEDKKPIFPSRIYDEYIINGAVMYFNFIYNGPEDYIVPIPEDMENEYISDFVLESKKYKITPLMDIFIVVDRHLLRYLFNEKIETRNFIYYKII